MMYWGIWILCGCLVSLMLYLLDSDKVDRGHIYTDNFYIFFVVLFWPIFVMLVIYSVLIVLINNIKLLENDIRGWKLYREMLSAGVKNKRVTKFVIKYPDANIIHIGVITGIFRKTLFSMTSVDGLPMVVTKGWTKLGCIMGFFTKLKAAIPDIEATMITDTNFFINVKKNINNDLVFKVGAFKTGGAND